MDANFSVQADPRTSLVWITIGGFFELPDIKRFAQARDAEHRRLRCGANQHLTLVDMRNMNIQKRESVEAFALLLSDPSSISRRLAFVVSVGLARSQIQRAAAGRKAGFFLKMEDAEAWLQRDAVDDYAPATDIVDHSPDARRSPVGLDVPVRRQAGNAAGETAYV